MNLFSQKEFLGGLTAQYNRVKLPGGSYPLLFNGRCDENVVSSVNKHIELSAPYGKKQGLYVAGSYLILFVEGNAYWADASLEKIEWAPISGWLPLSSSVDVIYAELIPAGSSKLVPHGEDPRNMSTFYRGSMANSPMGLFVTDGISQPRIILSDLSWRIIKTYNEWTIDDPEYVPIGVLPKMSGTRLYLVDSATKTKIYASVSGRPLDFVINRDTNGNKGGDADTTCKVIDYNPITSLVPIAQEGLLVSTLYHSYGLVPDNGIMLFGEPILQSQFNFNAGVINAFSYVNMLKDMAFLSQYGIQSFNVTMELKRESNNFPLGAPIASYLELPLQYGATVLYDTKALFATNTIFGDAVIVYDTIRNIFTSIDTGFGRVKQFALVKLPGIRRLFFINASNKLYEAYASKDKAVCSIYLGDFSPLEGDVKFRVEQLYISFVDVIDNVEVQVTPYCDGYKEKTSHGIISTKNKLRDSLVKNTETLSIGFGSLPNCWKFGAMIEWQGNAKLAELSIGGSSEMRDVEKPGELSDSEEIFILFTGSPSRLPIEKGIKYIGLGNHSDGTLDSAKAALSTLLQKVPRSSISWIAGEHELDVFKGKYFYEALPSISYFKKLFDNIEIFFYNSGYNSSGIVVEPDGITLGSNQATWLQYALESSTKPFKLVVMHHSPYSSYDSRADLRFPFKSWGVNMVIYGHYGVYERLEDETGLPYVNLSSTGYVRMKVTKYSLTLEQIENGVIEDAYTIKA